MPDLQLEDLSSAPKWGVFEDILGVQAGTAAHRGSDFLWSVSPGEWTILGNKPEGAVDLTHVRAMFRFTGMDTPEAISRVCALDLRDSQFPNGSSARTLFAGIAVELIRDDQVRPSYLIVVSRSYAIYLLEVLRDISLGLELEFS